MPQPMIELKGVKKSYRSEDNKEEIPILNQLDLAVYPGQFIAIQGESGSGKTTLLRIIGLMDNTYQGGYFFSGQQLHGGEKNITPWSLQEEIRATNIGFIFQEDRLLGHLKTRINIELPALIHNWSRKKRRDKLEELTKTGKVFSLKEMGDRLLEKKRSQMSGGQRQRAAVCRAIALSPTLILADEPTANLDPKRKEEIVEILRELCHDGHTVIVVSHDQVFEKADIVYTLQDGQLIVKSKKDEIPGQVTQAPDDAQNKDDDAQTIQTQQDTPPKIAFSPKPQVTSFPLPTKTLKRFHIWGGLKPRASLLLHINLALKDLLFRSRMFTLLIIGALAIGSFQATIFLSLHTGTNELLDDLIRAGSRLTRISISTKDLLAEERFPDLEQIKKIPAVTHVIFRREGVYRVKDVLGRDRGETLFGLQDNDPENRLLKFTTGREFSSENALEVIMSERNIKRLFKVPGDLITDEFRTSLLDKPISFVIVRPKIAGDSPQNYKDPEDMPREEFRFQLKLIGIVAQAESGRNFYFPKNLLLILERWRLDESRKFKIPLTASGDNWTVSENDIRQMLHYQWAERAHVYVRTINDVIATHVRLIGFGYEPQSDIFQNLWIIDARRLSRYLLAGLVGLAVVIGMFNIANNISTSVQIRRKEIVLFKLLGMRVGDISAIYVWNAIIASLIGTLVGFVVGSLTVSGLSNFLASQYKDAIFAKLFAPTWPFLGMIILAGGVIAIMASLWPAYRAGQLNLVEGFES